MEKFGRKTSSKTICKDKKRFLAIREFQRRYPKSGKNSIESLSAGM